MIIFGKGTYMQVNSVNSFSNAQAFRGAEGEGKKINKGAVAAGVVAAAAVATTVAAGLHGKKVFVGPPEANKAKNALTYVRTGFKDALGVINKHIASIRETIAEKFAKKAPEATELPNDVL